jgi:uncharacterized membrane protein YqjE
MSIARDARTLSADVLKAIGTRLELFGLEWQQAKADLPRLIVLSVAAVVCLVFAVSLFTLFLIVLFWDTGYRDAVVLGLCLLYLFVGLILLWRLWSIFKSGSVHPFSATMQELERDALTLLGGLEDDRSGASSPADREVPHGR